MSERNRVYVKKYRRVDVVENANHHDPTVMVEVRISYPDNTKQDDILDLLLEAISQTGNDLFDQYREAHMRGHHR